MTEGHRIFAFGYERLASRQDARGTAEHRARLLAPATGRAIEVGAGTGLNLRHYPAAVDEVVALEPDPHMYRRLTRALATSTAPVRAQRAWADALPVEDASVETVVFSLVLCSVPDQVTAIAEAYRVLRPGGRLLFFEHVRAAEERLSRWQDRLERPWGLLAGGCHPNRSTVATIEAAGFRLDHIDRWDERGAFLAKPHVLGMAVRD